MYVAWGAGEPVCLLSILCSCARGGYVLWPTHVLFSSTRSCRQSTEVLASRRVVPCSDASYNTHTGNPPAPARLLEGGQFSSLGEGESLLRSPIHSFHFCHHGFFVQELSGQAGTDWGRRLADSHRAVGSGEMGIQCDCPEAGLGGLGRMVMKLGKSAARPGCRQGCPSCC